MKYGKFITRTAVHPTIEIDCQDGTHEYCEAPPPGGLKLGRFVTRTVAHPTIRPDTRPGIKLLVELDADVDPDEALIHVGRVIQQVQDLDPELKLSYDSAQVNDWKHIEIYLAAGPIVDAEGRLKQLVERLQRKPVVAKPARLKSGHIHYETAANGAKA